MATDKEYKAVIDALSGECERLHKENEELKALSQEPISPCDVCMYNPPSSTDGKPCCMCPAERRAE